MTKIENSDEMMRRLQAQSILFSEIPSRSKLYALNLKPNPKKKYFINIWRNHNFELIESLMSPYFTYQENEMVFQIGHYDESLSFINRDNADLEIIWLEPNLITSQNKWGDWIQERLSFLRSQTTSPILIATWFNNADHIDSLKKYIKNNFDLYLLNLRELSEKYKVNLINEKLKKATGTLIDREAQILIARELACHWIPSLILPPIKAIILDLDNTLHNGVLEEDGFQDIELSKEHINLQLYLKGLKDIGIFLALASKNQHEDVEQLFQKRDDYPLQLNDFSVIEASWGSKHEAIERIASQLNIAYDSMLFIDDNPGEILSTFSKINDLNYVLADRNPSQTMRSIDFFPGIFKIKFTEEDGKRSFDIKANQKRKKMLSSSISSFQYLKSLDIELHFYNDKVEHINRIAELSSKTNQFNLNLNRYNSNQILNFIKNEKFSVNCIQLIDRISDSGIVGSVICELVGKTLIIHEACISCRALGRQMEDLIILNSIINTKLFPKANIIVFNSINGPRNKPALDWLSKIKGPQISVSSEDLSNKVKSLEEYSLVSLNFY